MSETEAETWLVGEARDLLAQGTFGLYELVWGLRGASFGLTDTEAVELAERVVRRFVDDGAAWIFAVSWPGLDLVDGPLTVDILRDSRSWSEGEEGPMIALVPSEPVTSAGPR
ncbi:hypothetical protein ACWKSP_08070 [Micromonosporaceae bacterium Da 78-11]